MLLHRMQRLANINSVLTQRLLQTHSFQGPDIFVLHQQYIIVYSTRI